MDSTIKTRWVEALRSGEYSQGQKLLAADGNFCCLGVLCELAVAERIVDRNESRDDRFSYNGETHVLPNSVREWAGLDYVVPSVTNTFSADARMNDTVYRPVIGLATLNDAGFTFAEIADIIEDEL